MYKININCVIVVEVNHFICFVCVGKKQDLWYVVDLLTGEKQQTLTSSFADMLCPSSSLLYLGRTGKKKKNQQSCKSSSYNWHLLLT